MKHRKKLYEVDLIIITKCLTNDIVMLASDITL